MRTPQINTLPYWWWPGQWLRIVYAVWFDQRWYWQYVRPLMEEPRRHRALTLQALLGTALIAVVLNLGLYIGLSWLIDSRWDQPVPDWLLIRAGLGFVGTILISMLLGMTLSGSATLGLPSSLICTLVPFLAGASSLHPFILAITATSGLAFSIARVVATGNSWSHFENSALPLLIAIDGIVSGDFVGGLVQAGVFMAATFVGSRWATRQVSNPQVRKQFARPRTSRFSLL
ncbi:MAG TPA: hypothetical protein VGD58_02380 [Herpetosiphonaceae bacterium]